jgi:hypothetical protein
VADTREPAAGTNPVLAMSLSRRKFLRLGLAGIVGLSLFLTPGCGSSQDSGHGKKDKNDGGGGAGGY